MRMQTYLFLLLLAALCLAGTRGLAGTQAARLLLKWKEGPSSPAAAAGNLRIGGTVKQTFHTLGWQVVELPPGMATSDGIDAYMALGTLAHVESDGPMHVEPPLPPATNSDAQFSTLKTLNPNDPLYGSQWSLPLIGAPTAWEVTKGDSNIVVVIIDTGVDYTHPELAPNMWRNPGESGIDNQGRSKSTNGIDDDDNGYVDDLHGINVLNGTGDPMDIGFWNTPTRPATQANYHGTFIAGIMGALGNNGMGMAGVAWSVQMMAINHYGGDNAVPITNFWSKHLAAWDYVLMMKRRGVNIRVSTHSYSGAVESSAVREAMAAAGNEGILAVCSAGNNAVNKDLYSLLPGSFNLPSVVCVAASTEAETLATFSAFGVTVDLAAPGVNITSISKGTDWGYGNGTSFSAPIVGGAAALLLSVRPDLSINELKAALYGSVDQPAGLRGKVGTHGRLNIARALQYLTNANPPAIVVMASPAGQRTSTNAPIQVTFSRPMNRASVESAFVISPHVSGTFEWTDDSRTFFFRQEIPWDRQTNYTVQILGTAQDDMGRTLDGDYDRTLEDSPADDYVWTFRFTIPNDDFADAELLSGLSGSVQSSNRYAFLELDEPYHVLNDSRHLGSSVWYRWTAPESGWFTFDLTSGTAFDSMLAVYTGDRLDRLVVIAGNDNYGGATNSRVSFAATAGTNYSVVVLGKSQVDPNQAGDFNLRWYPTPSPVITTFAPSIAYSGEKVTLHGTNFIGVTRVLFNGLPALIQNVTNAAFSDLQIIVTVPSSASTGPITIESAHGSFVTTSNFTIQIPPQLAVRLLPEGKLVELSWPVASGFSLQRSEVLSSSNWLGASSVSSRTTNGIRIVTVTNSVPTRFFRLRRL